MAVTNNGSAEAFPVVVFSTSGGTAILYHLKNTSTDDEIYFNYTMQDGELATLDLRKGQKTFTSTFSGNLLSQGKILEGSDIATFHLLPGSNDISIYTEANCTVTMQWDNQYLSFDG
jgi:hypothetical protein